MLLGRAVVDITPPVGLHLAGWAGKRFSNSIHQPLSCRVLYLQSDDKLAVLISVDLLGMSRRMADEVRQQIEVELGVPASTVMISSTHTHSGPLLPPWWTQESPPDQPYLDELKRKIVGAVVAARQAPMEVTVGHGTGRGELGISRRLPYANGKVDFPPRADPNGTVDPEVGVLRFDAKTGNTVAVVFSYGCHPTVAGPSSWLGPDYPGPARLLVEQYFDGATAMFLLGNCADVRSNYTNADGSFRWDTTTELVEQAGARVGAEVIKVAVQIETEPNQPLRLGRTFSDIYMENGEVAETCEFQAFQIGKAAVVTNPGECFAQIGLDVRDQTKMPLLFSSVTNGMLGYVPTKEAYRYGGYEVETSYSSFGLAHPIRADGERVFREGMLEALRQCTVGS